MREEIYRELFLAIQELPDRSREVFELHLQGKKNEEIAEVLAIQVKAVKAYRRDTITFLKSRLGNKFCWFVFMNVI